MTKSNSHAKVPAAYYVDTINELGACSKLLQTDCGTENVLMAASRLQVSVHAHRYSSSIANIRIENWSLLEEQGMIQSLEGPTNCSF